MNKSKKKFVVAVLGAQLITIPAINMINSGKLYVYADEALEKGISYKGILSKEAVRYKVLEGYGFGEKYNSEFAAYLKKNGISDAEYRKYINDTEKYNGSKEEKTYEVEELLCVFDTVLYTNPVVKSIYEINKESVKDKDKAWEMMKKSYIYDVDWLTQIYEEAFDSADMEKVYKYIFKKNPTTTIINDLSKKSTLKYGLYSGLLGRELTSDDRDKISAGKGYELSGISKSEYEEYLKFLNIRNKINECEIRYIKEYYIHSNVRSKIKNKYGVDIFTKLSDKQRLSVYNASLVNFNYNDSIAQGHMVDYLVFNGVIKGPGSTDLPQEDIGGTGTGSIYNPLLPEKNPQVLKPSEENNLNNDGYYGEFGDDWKAFLPSEMSNLTVQYYYNGKYKLDGSETSDNKNYYYMKIGDNTYLTNVLVEKEFTESTLRDVLEQVFEELKWKVVESSDELLVFVNNEIVIIKRQDTYNLKELNESLNKIKVLIGEVSQKQIEDLQKSEKLKEKESDIDA